MDKCFATWISCTLLKILSISISLSQVAASYYYYFLDSSLSYVLCLSCSFCSSYVHWLFWTAFCLLLGQKRGDILHIITFDIDEEMTSSWSWQCLYVLDIWYVDHDHFLLFFLCICGYWTWFLTHECILTIFRQVIFVDICGYLCQFIQILWKCLGIWVGDTNVFLEIYLQVL